MNDLFTRRLDWPASRRRLLPRLPKDIHLAWMQVISATEVLSWPKRRRFSAKLLGSPHLARLEWSLSHHLSKIGQASKDPKSA